jgi:DMSO/TMAO reductase YedYZ heme-binding membrane subunit
MQRVKELLKYWFGGVRIYIAFAAVIVTLEAWWWSATLFGGGQLMVIRLQEVYAWICVGLLATVLAIGPVTKLFPKLPGKTQIFDSRRAFGLSAAWFATLHILLTYFKQFNAVNPFSLPTNYKWAMLYGVIALAILLAMAATSVNAVFNKWGIWWFRLHRLVYAAVILILVHAFMIGSQATDTGALIALSSAALLWVGANLALLMKTPKVQPARVASVCVAILLLGGVLTFGLNQHFEKSKASAQLLEHQH